ncbi:MAG: ATP-binding cassette domain-containing protein [Eubacterium sp.]|nr:ATP-binding cassette domain-containing protein [Eubacterium sp.]
MVVEDLKMHFPITKGILKKQIGTVKAVDGVSFSIMRGETLGIVGESGSGKSTIGNCILGPNKITSGRIMYEGQDMANISSTAMRRLRNKLQVISQDPFSSMDPRMSIGDIVTEGLRIHQMTKSKAEERDIALRMLEMVGIRPDYIDRYPHEFSGGQRQRICIARALALQPNFIVCDEIVSALDVSIQAQIIQLMMKLQKELSLTYVFIGHDLSVVRHISDSVMVMYLGKMMELTNSKELYKNPLHPYTRALISAAPIPDPEVDRKRERIILKGEIPSPIHPPEGCKFCTRCPYAKDLCYKEEPKVREVTEKHLVACHFVDETGFHGERRHE